MFHLAACKDTQPYNSKRQAAYLLGAKWKGASASAENSTKYSGCIKWLTGACAALSPSTMPPLYATKAAKATGTSNSAHMSESSCHFRSQTALTVCTSSCCSSCGGCHCCVEFCGCCFAERCCSCWGCCLSLLASKMDGTQRFMTDTYISDIYTS